MKARCALFVLVMLGWASGAAAQRPAATYVVAGAALDRQSGPTGTQSETYVTAPGGTTRGWLIGGGVRVAKHAAVEAEWSTTGRMTATEPSRYFTTYQEERRDRFLSVGVGFPIALPHAIELAPIAGLVFTMAHGWSQSIYTDDILPRPLQPRVTHVLDKVIGPFVGGDVSIGTGRVAVVPSVRLFRSAVSGGRWDGASTSPHVDIESIYPGGYPSWTVRTAVALRIRI